MKGKIVKRDLPPSPRQRLFRPVITADGQLQAGDCTLARVERTEGADPVLVFRDRCRPRSRRRGTEDIRVWLREIVEAVEGQDRGEPERPLGNPTNDPEGGPSEHD